MGSRSTPCALLLASLVLAASPRADAKAQGPVRFYVMADTQSWARNLGGTTLATWRAVAQAICRQRDRFAMVLHTGDLVNDSRQGVEWDNAVSVLHELDACGMPWAIAFGNRDFDDYTGDVNAPLHGDLRWRAALNKLAHRPLQVGPSGRTALHDLAPGWFVLVADYIPSQADLDWMSAAIGARRQARFVLLSHTCVSPSGLIAGDWCERLLERHPEIRIAVSGHWIGPAREVWTEIPRKNADPVVLLFQNYQHVPELAAFGVVVELDSRSGEVCVWSEDVLRGAVGHPAVASSPAGPVTAGGAKRCFAGAAKLPR